MDYLRLLYRESEDVGTQLAIIGVFESIANVILMATVLAAANKETASFGEVQLAIIFSLCLLIFLLFRSHLMNNISRLIEAVVRSIRMRITDRVRKAELVSLESVGRPDILQVLAQDCQTLYDSAQDILTACGQAAVLVCSIFYLSIVSFNAFLAIGATLVGGIVFSLRNYRNILKGFEQARREEERFFSILNDQLVGFKELRIHEDKARDFYENDVTVSALRTERLKLAAAIQSNLGTNLSQAFFFFLLGGIVFVLPKFMEPGTATALTISKIVAVFLFIDAPIELIARTIPIYTRANVAARNIGRLDKRLGEMIQESIEEQSRTSDFQRLRCNQLTFRFPARPNLPQDAFRLGPIDLQVNKGEIIFLTGGNGSGKSTFLNLLCGLLAPTSGQLIINDNVGIREQRAQYRSYFSTILHDYHLFGRLLGHSHKNRDRVPELLTKLRLDGVTAIDEKGNFTNLHLSAGQKKRLALLVTECDDREILLFDEWAADQDPEFRRYFYEEYLHELKARGKTIIAATHDDRYFHVADRVLHLERGTLSERTSSTLPYLGRV